MSQRYAKSLEKDSRFAKIDSHFAKRESIFAKRESFSNIFAYLCGKY